MSTQHVDGGPAFPHMMTEGHRDYAPGLSLRDWFAGQALPGLTAGAIYDPQDGVLAIEIAHRAYSIADAMLKARGTS